MEKGPIVFLGRRPRWAIAAIPSGTTALFVDGSTFRERDGGWPIHWDLLRTRAGGLSGLYGEGLEELHADVLEFLRRLDYVEIRQDALVIWLGDVRVGVRGQEGALRGLSYRAEAYPREYALDLSWFFAEASEFERWTAMRIAPEKLRYS